MSEKKYDPIKRRERYLRLKAQPGYMEKRREQCREYYKKNKGRINENAKEYAKEHRDEINAKARDRRREKFEPFVTTCPVCYGPVVHDKIIHGRQRIYCSDKCQYEVTKAKARARYPEHKDEIKTQAKKWHKENRERANFLSRLRRQLKKLEKKEHNA